MTPITLLFNWRTLPYHAPIVLGQHLGYYEEEGAPLALLEPHNPSDVPAIFARGSVDLALKAIIHTVAMRGRGDPVVSVATLLDEPFTGLLYLQSSGIESFADLAGKRVGYVGHFGKIMVDDLARRAGIKYEVVRVGMNVTDHIARGTIDAGIGIGCHHKLELEERCGPTGMLRIDELAGLGCCCFCSIQFICSEQVLEEKRETIAAILRATQRATHFILDEPEVACDLFCEARPEQRTSLNQKIFTHTLPFLSRTLENVERDWNKVFGYARHLGVVSDSVTPEEIYTNTLLPKAPYSPLQPLPL